MHPKLAPFFQGREHFYPKALETGYPRVFNAIIDKWGNPELENYLEDLMVDKRGGRQGFPPDVMNDILTLSRIHGHVQSVKMAGVRKKEDVWSHEPIKKALQAEQIGYSKEGLFRSAELGNERALALFVKAGIDLELKNAGDWTPLIIAVSGGKLKAANMLISAGANVNAGDSQGLTALHWAAFKGFPRLAELLVEKGADVDARSNLGLTPLSQAVTSAHTETVNILLAKRANVNAADSDGLTPLHKAVADSNLEVVKLLVAAGADPQAKSVKGLTPAAIARQRNKPDIMAMLSA